MRSSEPHRHHFRHHGQRRTQRHVKFVKTGMSVRTSGTAWALARWRASASPAPSDGVAQHPTTIVADNLEGTLQVNSSINHPRIASQNDNCLVLPLQAGPGRLRTGTEFPLTVVYVQATGRRTPWRSPSWRRRSPRGHWPGRRWRFGIQDNYNVQIKSAWKRGPWSSRRCSLPTRGVGCSMAKLDQITGRL